MRIEAIRTGSVAVRESQTRGAGRGVARLARTLADPEWTAPLPIHAWVIDHPEGIIVVDSGESARATEPGYFPRWHPYFRRGLREAVRSDEEIGPALGRLGIDPREVPRVVLTHLHTDHAGGLHHFPNAEFVVTRDEFEAASGFRGKLRGYLPHRWPDFFRPRLVDFDERPLLSFDRSVPLTRAGDVHLVPTPGHSRGHASVVVREGDRFVFLAGDVSYTEEFMLEGVVDGVAPDVHAARDSVDRVRAFASAAPTVYLPSHDPRAAQRLAARQVTPAELAMARAAPSAAASAGAVA